MKEDWKFRLLVVDIENGSENIYFNDLKLIVIDEDERESFLMFKNFINFELYFNNNNVILIS